MNVIIFSMMQKRYRSILFFFGRVILSFIWWQLILPKIGLRRLSRASMPKRLKNTAVAFRHMAIDMGGVMIKVGQFLSSRLDVLPPEITAELAGLQDEVLHADFEQIRPILESELEMPLEEKFISFDTTVRASASIGQVYTAAVNVDGQSIPVVVKVQRPKIDQIVEVDLSALRVVAGWLMRYAPIRRRANIPALMEEFSRSLYEEIDYMNEGKNAEIFADNFRGQPDICVPRIYWSHTTRRVLTLEDVEGIKIGDYAAIEASGISRVEVAERFFKTYLQQIFEDRFFHADPHPGNLFVLPLGEKVEGEPRRWQLAFIDFGMTGQISSSLVSGLKEILIGVGTQDVPRMVKAYQTMGVLLPSADTTLLEAAMQRIFERFWGKATNEIMQMSQSEAEAFMKEFGSVLYDLPFQIPENIILLGRCVNILSGMCSGLDPTFNVFKSVVPYTKKMVDAEAGPAWKVVLDEVGGYANLLIALPRRADHLLNKIERGQLEVRTPRLEDQVGRVDRSLRKTARAVVFAVFLATAVQSYLSGEIALAVGLGVGALFSLGSLLFFR